jgi:hypothetical protein
MNDASSSGKLKIGDDWNAITIIALSQNNPLKAVAEFVENSIDAHAKNITIIRGKEHDSTYLKITDDGQGIDDLSYVATHIGDSIKRKLKKAGEKGLQGEFGIGLMSFWIIGEELTLTSCGSGGDTRRMTLMKNNPGYNIVPVKGLFHGRGTELMIRPLLPGIKMLTGEKIQNYLASELRNRITQSGVKITIHDKTSRRSLLVEPRQFKGRLLHGLPELKSPLGDIWCELYFTDANPDNGVALCKSGTRVIPQIGKLDGFDHHPWDSPYLEGLIDASFLQLTPGTRDGVIRDEAFESFVASMAPLETALASMIEEQKKAEDDTASRAILSQVSKAFKEALTMLPEQDYQWLGIQSRRSSGGQKGIPGGTPVTETGDPLLKEDDSGIPLDEPENTLPGMQKSFFDYAGPVHKIRIVPAKATIPVGAVKKLKLTATDRAGRAIDAGFDSVWTLLEGPGTLGVEGEYAIFTAADEPAVSWIIAEVKVEDRVLTAECLITATAELGGSGAGSEAGPQRGLPNYTFVNAAGELWRSRFRFADNLIEVNKGHADFIYASRMPKRKLRYIARLFAKELILFNFPELSRDQLLERMAELMLYLEESL